MEGGGFAAAQPSIVRKESGGALAWNRGHLLLYLQYAIVIDNVHGKVLINAALETVL